MANFFSLRTVRWRDGSVLLIDQTELPRKLRYIECRNYMEVAHAIQKMVVRGAPAIGAAAAMGLGLVAHHSRARTREGLLRELDMAARVLRGTRPTGFNLFWAVSRIMHKARSTVGEPEHVAGEVVKEAKRIAEEDVQANRKIGEYGSSLLVDGDTVLTHCN